MAIGAALRRWRKNRGLTLQAVADRTGLSIGYLSQIERDLASPTLDNLWRICQVLNIPIHRLFAGNHVHGVQVVRRKERRIIRLPMSRVAYHLLTPPMRTKLEVLLVELEPGQSSEETISHEGEELGYVLQGRLKVRLGESEYILEEGDSIWFESHIPHRFINAGEDLCVSLWAMTPPSF